MAKKLIILTDDFAKVVGEYQKANNLRTWTQAFLALAAQGYQSETGNIPPDPYVGWGGWRGKEDSLKALIAYADKHSDGGRNDPAENEPDEPGEAD